MAYGKIVTINYETSEQAASMAAKINAAEQSGEVRAFSNGQTLEIVPSNPVFADLFTFFSKINAAVSALFKKFEGNSKHTAQA